MNDTDIILCVSDFVALVNQTFEYAYSSVTIAGELANFRVSKNKWVYFDLKDEFASLRFFGTVYTLPGPLEDGMVLEVRGNPRLHPQFGFSVNVQSIRPVGEGSIKKAANLLEAKLRTEGLFDEARKRPLPYPPQTIGLITSRQSAAYADFIKIVNQRWRGVDIQIVDVQVQGEAAPGQIISAIEQLNQAAEQPDVLVLIRGGGSADDLQAFSTEQVTRAVAASRVPTLVAIGHEVDISLAELAADQRASTPSNAAELLVPDRRAVFADVTERRVSLKRLFENRLQTERQGLGDTAESFHQSIEIILRAAKQTQNRQRQLLAAFSPEAVLRRGYAIVRDKRGRVVRRGRDLVIGGELRVEFSDARLQTQIKAVESK